MLMLIKNRKGMNRVAFLHIHFRIGHTPFLSRENKKRTIYDVQTTVLRTLHSHGMFQDMGISCRISSALRLL